MSGRYLGIDFSGGASAWRNRASRPTVWISTVDVGSGRPELADLVPVQDLPGDGNCFSRLVRLLSRGDFVAAAIDAPFSLPLAHVPAGGHQALVDLVGKLPDAVDRPFPRGATLMTVAEATQTKATAKPLRSTELLWVRQSVNTRSTLWNGPRGGAPFAVACLALISRSGRPCWPWVRGGAGMLVEAFPGAQLRRWGLPHQGYSGETGAEARRRIVAALGGRISLATRHEQAMCTSPDALDAVLAAFGAIATSSAAETLPPEAALEGWISVHP